MLRPVLRELIEAGEVKASGKARGTALDAAGQVRLTRDLEELLAARNGGGPDSLVVQGEYLEVVILRR